MGHIGKTVSQNVVSGSEITDGTVDTADLADDAVTQAKIGADAVGTTELANDVAISTSGNISTTGDLTVDSTLFKVDATNDKIIFNHDTNKGVLIQDAGLTDATEISFSNGTNGIRSGLITGSNLSFYTGTAGGGSATKKMEISTEGYITKPLQPMLSRFTNTTQSVASATYRAIVFDGTTYVSSGGSGISASNGDTRFTVPVDGTYYVSARIRFQNASDVNTATELKMNMNDAYRGYNYRQHNRPYESMWIDALMDMSASDYFEIWLYQASGSNQTITHTASGACQLHAWLVR